MHISYLDAIKSFEGYAPQARWDYAQLTNGYGTKAKYAGEVIDTAEANRRFEVAVTKARAVVEQHAGHVDEGTKAALTSLTYNAGDKWVSSGLGDAVRRGDLDSVREIFQRYNKAGGEVLPGLVSRRAAEALWIGNPQLVGTEVVVAEAAPGEPPMVPASELPAPPVLAHAAELKEGAAAVAIAEVSRGEEAVAPVAVAVARELEAARPLPIIPVWTVDDSVSLPGTITTFGRPSMAASEASLLASRQLADVAQLVRLDIGHELLAAREDRRVARERGDKS